MLDIYTLLGGRSSIIKTHLKKLSLIKTSNLRIIALSPPENRVDIINWIKRSQIVDRLVMRKKGTFNAKIIDGSYDLLIRKYGESDKFLIIHDDTIIKKTPMLYFENLREKTFIGAIDNAFNLKYKSVYQQIFWENTALNELRLGTWYLGGYKRNLIKSKLYFGSGTVLMPIISNIYYKTFKLKVKKIYAKVDGGYNFNIKARRLNYHLKIIDPMKDGTAEHFTRLTAGFSNRGMMKHFDNKKEISSWGERIEKLLKLKDRVQLNKDYDFLNSLVEYYELNNIQDDLINRTQINDLFKKYEEFIN
jgi:hypothetical protein